MTVGACRVPAFRPLLPKPDACQKKQIAEHGRKRRRWCRRPRGRDHNTASCRARSFLLSADCPPARERAADPSGALISTLFPIGILVTAVCAQQVARSQAQEGSAASTILQKTRKFRWDFHRIHLGAYASVQPGCLRTVIQVTETGHTFDAQPAFNTKAPPSNSCRLRRCSPYRQSFRPSSCAVGGQGALRADDARATDVPSACFR